MLIFALKALNIPSNIFLTAYLYFSSLFSGKNFWVVDGCKSLNGSSGWAGLLVGLAFETRSIWGGRLRMEIFPKFPFGCISDSSWYFFLIFSGDYPRSLIILNPTKNLLNRPKYWMIMTLQSIDLGALEKHVRHLQWMQEKSFTKMKIDWPNSPKLPYRLKFSKSILNPL